MLLLTGEVPSALSLMTPKGIFVEVEPVFCRLEGERAVCAVKKDAGDDPENIAVCLITSFALLSRA